MPQLSPRPKSTRESEVILFFISVQSDGVLVTLEKLGKKTPQSLEVLNWLKLNMSQFPGF